MPSIYQAITRKDSPEKIFIAPSEPFQMSVELIITDGDKVLDIELTSEEIVELMDALFWAAFLAKGIDEIRILAEFMRRAADMMDEPKLKEIANEIERRAIQN